MPLVVPSPGDLKPDVDLVLVIGDKEFDRPAENGAAEVFDRHARDFNAAGAGQVGVRTRLVVKNANDKGFGFRRRRGEREQKGV